MAITRREGKVFGFFSAATAIFVAINIVWFLLATNDKPVEVKPLHPCCCEYKPGHWRDALSLDEADRGRALANLRKLGWTINIEERDIGYAAVVVKGNRGGRSMPQETQEDAEEAAITLVMSL